MASDAQRFSLAVAHLMAAEMQDRTMRDAALPQSARDQATRAYCGTVDNLVAELAELRRRGILRRIVGFLQEQDGEAEAMNVIVLTMILFLFWLVSFGMGVTAKVGALLLTVGCQ